MQVETGRLLHTVLGCLQQLEAGKSVLLQPYKKDRSVLVSRFEEGYRVLEDGFVKKEYQVGEEKIRKLLKKLIRKEFPRSNRVWLSRVETKKGELLTNRSPLR
jgi:hypothetical protein